MMLSAASAPCARSAQGPAFRRARQALAAPLAQGDAIIRHRDADRVRAAFAASSSSSHLQAQQQPCGSARAPQRGGLLCARSVAGAVSEAPLSPGSAQPVENGRDMKWFLSKALLASLFLVWYAGNISFNIYNKQLLKVVPLPVLVRPPFKERTNPGNRSAAEDRARDPDCATAPAAAARRAEPAAALDHRPSRLAGEHSLHGRRRRPGLALLEDRAREAAALLAGAARRVPPARAVPRLHEHAHAHLAQQGGRVALSHHQGAPASPAAGGRPRRRSRRRQKPTTRRQPPVPPPAPRVRRITPRCATPPLRRQATEPLFVTAAAAIVLGTRPSKSLVASMIPIVIGVSMASATDISFSWIGFLAAMGSNLASTLRNVYSKQVMSSVRGNIDSVSLLTVVNAMAFVMLLPLLAIWEGCAGAAASPACPREHSAPPHPP